MNFISEQGYDAKLGKLGEFQKWLETNEEKLRASCPAGVEYEGTYAVVHTSEKEAGSFRTLWRLENYGAQDAFAAAMKEPSSFQRLMEEFSEFVDNRNDAKWSDSLYKNAVAASLWADHE